MSSSDPSIPAESRSVPETSAAAGGKQHTKPQLEPGLYIVSTPIGNLRDITLRALDTLSSADEVLAEDTRVARKLLDAHGIRAKLSAYHDHNGADRRPGILKQLQAGARIALVSDAGTPLVSDPGWKLAHEAAEAGIRIVPIPGASAMLAGLVTSGLPSDRFMFCGFLPAKSGQRKRELEALKPVPATLIFYEGGSRLAGCLEDMADILGAVRPAAVARELTKLFEETRRGTLGDLAAHYRKAGPPKGEIVILAGPPAEEDASPADIDAALRKALADSPVKEAANAVAAAFSISKRDAYQRALALKSDG
ncbi:16S rRNA (cytidine(1402)-2'-O)-methyltransferase [Henriciella mobilis]|uniref:Ribosomal RNA small subunit methyltransferase I n=1 Tax=Henriciella mobilis TaxID=2305467 RepID=A0A399RJA2_9PROT|nr:16S rRNA (cytidine(1402)-2'-O)-methyltransferase [Henriciella mobilis]RIJ18254.1 16S rRNA (cytidine(1402)-2'-O)-methyltransferase [Henriciella mobilis]RIJ25675.1 16S rRNA (cytidine(1402)-2'-O)-methyltransferase [Henriciella mobilis]RIJ30731.1 16S rRNA (cytidine(1402)-2'-O)-methyltransferase [Henriciella mobilis]